MCRKVVPICMCVCVCVCVCVGCLCAHMYLFVYVLCVVSDCVCRGVCRVFMCWLGAGLLRDAWEEAAGTFCDDGNILNQ